MSSCASLICASEGGSCDFGVLNSRMSAPPENTLGEPQMTAALTAGSASAFLMLSRMPGRSLLPRPLTGGLFIVMTAMPSRTEYETASLIYVDLQGERPFYKPPCARGTPRRASIASTVENLVSVD